MKTALLIIATGAKYQPYARNLIISAYKYFVPHNIILFTNAPWITVFKDDMCDIIPYHHDGYPEASYYRYEAFWRHRDILSQYDQVFFSDADMRFVAPVSEDEIFSDGVVATEHPGYVGRAGTPETNPLSTAYCPKVRNYFCGGFNGGETQAFLKMSKELMDCINDDERNGVRAIWVDESQLNRYLYDHPPSKILSPSFCYPEKDDYYKQIWKEAGRGPFEPKLLALEKGNR